MTPIYIAESLNFWQQPLLFVLRWYVEWEAWVINLGIEGFMISGAFFQSNVLITLNQLGMEDWVPFIGL